MPTRDALDPQEGMTDLELIDETRKSNMTGAIIEPRISRWKREGERKSITLQKRNYTSTIVSSLKEHEKPSSTASRWLRNETYACERLS